MNAPLSLASVQQTGGAVAATPNFAPGFGSSHAFDLMIRQSKLLMATTLVPSAYRDFIVKLDRFGNIKESRENPNALANCAVALNMATRMGADPLMVMQNLYIVEGRPSWSSQWIIAAINSCGRFSPLRFEIKVIGPKEVPYTTTYWENQEKRSKTEMVKIIDKVAVAWAKELATGERLESPPISIEMAVKEGWYTKNGSKWQTMDEVMLRYRTASFFGKLYAPELLMGLQSTEEVNDFIDMEPSEPRQQAQAPKPIEVLREEPVRGSNAQAEQQQAAWSQSQSGQPQPDVDQDTGEILAGKEPAALAQPAGTVFDADAFALKLQACDSTDTLDVLADEIRGIANGDMALTMTDIYRRRRAELENGGAPQHAQPAATRRRGRADGQQAAPE